MTFPPFCKTISALPLIFAFSLFVPKSWSQEPVGSTASLSLQFIIDEYIPRISIFRPTDSVLARMGKPVLVDQSLQVDLPTLGIRNIVAAVRLSNNTSPSVDIPGNEYDFRKKVLTILNDRIAPRVVWTNGIDELVLKLDTSFEVESLRGRDKDSTIYSFSVNRNEDRILDCNSLETGFHVLDCPTAPWLTLGVLIWPNDFVGISDEQGLVRIEGLPSNTDLELLLFHERAVGGRIGQLSIGGRLHAKKRGVFTFRLDDGNNDLGQIKVMGREFDD